MAAKICTIGYEASSPDNFLAALQKAGVTLLVDIRAVAVSRRKGFSKTALSNAVRAAGVDYVHLRDLGDPKPGREAARAGRISEFRTIYETHLKQQEAQEALQEVIAVAKQRIICLLCYESEPMCCHRAIVAASVARKTGLVIEHLHAGPRQDTD